MLYKSSASHFNIHLSAPLRMQYIRIHDPMPCGNLLPRNARGQGESRACAGDRPIAMQKAKAQAKAATKDFPSSDIFLGQSCSPCSSRSSKHSQPPPLLTNNPSPMLVVGSLVNLDARFGGGGEEQPTSFVLRKLAMHCNWGARHAAR
ncbi:hypothetical protein CORC01_07779 [Colletotrichum orchidophilum]|uniref:Uncharacterized protein n=1 Tax=Colletotrichum orchidophilum TaxID=1209926 RepID=A0A1G4B6H2_9PEZI|nr:uncharacterized protein CORC01_07779 [Colletotrichum orchidophilum]OHE96994.1 hypothetical protein CORC01_07779 [Colletotrichum orchidophilum]